MVICRCPLSWKSILPQHIASLRKDQIQNLKEGWNWRCMLSYSHKVKKSKPNHRKSGLFVTIFFSPTSALDTFLWYSSYMSSVNLCDIYCFWFFIFPSPAVKNVFSFSPTYLLTIILPPNHPSYHKSLINLPLLCICFIGRFLMPFEYGKQVTECNVYHFY